MKRHLLTGIILSMSIGSMAVTAPDFTLTDIHGVSHKLSDYTNDGKWVLIDMFATWCGPCKTTAAPLGEVFHEYGDNERNLIVLGVSVDGNDTKAKIEEFEETYGGDYHYPVVAGNATGVSSMKNTYSSANIYEGYVPTIILVGPQNREVLYGEAGGLNKAGILRILNDNEVPKESVAIEKVAAQSAPAGYVLKATAAGLQCTAPVSGSCIVSAHLLNGRTIFNRNVNLSAGENTIPLAQAHLLRGQLVLVTLTGAGVNAVTRMVLK